MDKALGQSFKRWPRKETKDALSILWEAYGFVMLNHNQVKVTQSCPTLCDPMDYTIHGILQARIQEWVAFPIFRGSSQPRDWTKVSLTVGRFFTSWAAREAQVIIKEKLNNIQLSCMQMKFIEWVTQADCHRILKAREIIRIWGVLKCFCSKFSKPGFSNTWTVNFQIFKLVLEKAEEAEIKLPISTGSWKKQEISRKTSISALLITPKPLTVWITINCWKFWKRWEY